VRRRRQVEREGMGEERLGFLDGGVAAYIGRWWAWWTAGVNGPPRKMGRRPDVSLRAQ
jgi:hypothetical protein